MNVLNKRIFLRIKSQWQKYLSLFLLLVIMISATSGFFVVSDSIKVLDSELMDKGQVEDGQIVSAYPLSDETIDSIEQLNVKTQRSYQLDIKIKQGKTLRAYQNRDEINIPIINSGRLASSETEIAINNRYASSNDLKIGDSITIPGKYLSDHKDKKLKIVGMFALPDYESAYSNNSDLIFNSIDFGIALFHEDFFTKIDENQMKYQMSYRYNKGDLTKDEKETINEEIIKKVNENNAILEFMDKGDNNGIKMLGNDMGGDRPMMLMLMSILILLISFLFGVSIVKTIYDESEIIGILLASGYSKVQVLFNYLASPLLISFIASIVGNILGYTVYISVYRNMYYTSFDLPNYESYFNLEALILTTIIPFAIILVFNLLYIVSKLKFTPLEFLKKNLKKNRKHFNISLLSKNFLSQFRSRVFLANIGDFLVIIIGTFITSILLLFGLGAEPTFDGYGDSLKSSMSANYQYVLKYPVEIDDANQAEKYTFIPAVSYHPIRKADESVQFIGLKEDSSYYPNLTLPKNKDEVVISSNFAKKFKLNIGDEVELKSHLFDEDMKLKISDIYDFNTFFVAFTSQEFANELIDQDSDFFNGYFSDEELDIDKTSIATKIDETIITDIAEQLNDIMGPTISIFIGVSLVFFIIFMYNLSKMITEKNQTSIAYLKILGYNSKEINKVYIRAISITILLTVLLSIPLQLYVMDRISYYAMIKVAGYIEFIIPYRVILISVILSLVTYALVAIFQSIKINRISFAQVLKNRE